MPAAEPARPLAGLLLTGGRSSRMGRDKALLPLGPDGRPLAAHLGSLLRTVASPVLEVGPGHAGGVIPTVDDPAEGPLVALVSGWRALQAMPDYRPDQAVLLLATDLPLVTAAVLQQVATATTHAAATATATAAASATATAAASAITSSLGAAPGVDRWATESVAPLVDRRRQPLCARWSAHALTHAAELVAAGERRLTTALDGTPVVELDLGDDAALLADVDEPADLERLGLDRP